MQLTVLGCSGSTPGPNAPSSGYLLEADGFLLGIELGNGTLAALQAMRDPFDARRAGVLTPASGSLRGFLGVDRAAPLPPGAAAGPADRPAAGVRARREAPTRFAAAVRPRTRPNWRKPT